MHWLSLNRSGKVFFNLWKSLLHWAICHQSVFIANQQHIYSRTHSWHAPSKKNYIMTFLLPVASSIGSEEAGHATLAFLGPGLVFPGLANLHSFRACPLAVILTAVFPFVAFLFAPFFYMNLIEEHDKLIEHDNLHGGRCCWACHRYLVPSRNSVMTKNARLNFLLCEE